MEISPLSSIAGESDRLGIDYRLVVMMAGPGIVPFVQTLPGPGEVTWTVEVLQNPDSERELTFDFGDGSSSTATIPRGTGSASLALVRFLPLGRYVQRATIVDVEEPSTGHAPTAQAVTGVGVGVDLRSDPASGPASAGSVGDRHPARTAGRMCSSSPCR